jgi:hypothetical protein
VDEFGGDGWVAVAGWQWRSMQFFEGFRMVLKSANLEHYWLSCDTFCRFGKNGSVKKVAKSGSCKIKVVVVLAVAGWQ